MIVFGAPRRYVQGPGALAGIGKELAMLGRSAVLIADARVMDLVGATMAGSAAAAGVALAPITFGGEITYAEIARITTAIGASRPDVIIAAGGQDHRHRQDRRARYRGPLSRSRPSRRTIARPAISPWSMMKITSWSRLRC